LFFLGLVRLCLNEFELQAPRKQKKLDAIAETCMQIRQSLVNGGIDLSLLTALLPNITQEKRSNWLEKELLPVSFLL
jgi:hypothetical protein